MKTVSLSKKTHNQKIAFSCPEIKPNIIEDSFFEYEGKVIGFYLTKIPDKCIKLLNVANVEFLSDRVPKTKMRRGTKEQAIENGTPWVEQMSTILGTTPKKEHFKRNYISASQVHGISSAKNFIKAMLLLCSETEKIIQELMPEQYKSQKKLISEKIPDQYRFKNLFTSSISNYNISAPFHQDRANLKETVNIIFAKRYRSTGGCLHVPDFDITIAQEDNSLLVYPAWANMHGVTPIKAKGKGYRNSFVFYPLNLS